jgi:hypothetical protein
MRYTIPSNNAEGRGRGQILLRSAASGTKAGQAALSLVFLVGGIVVLVGATLAFLAFSFISSGIGFQNAQKAYAVASAGATDSLLRLNRDKDYSVSNTNVPIGGDTASVKVEQNTPSQGLVTITSQASVAFYSRKISVVASVSSSTGQVNIISWKLVQF